MARISLRSYNHEIEELIERDQYDQAIAHCRHILKFYPKCIDTYRLLGKVYLESQHYGDAADILQRILSSVPEDFVSHVGMSIIREDEGNLDDSIWHMERAFEMQPANSAIQGELRRLYGRRDGVEPPKVRLTRGALARMYFKGNLYPQAIAEIRVALAEESSRLDLQVLLAQAYYHSGQRVEAAETCSNLLKKLPYSLEANWILADVLVDTERADEAQAYRQRVQALDPYSSHVSPNAPTSDKVPDTAVVIEKLEWRPGRVSGTSSTQPEWAASLGVEVGGLTNKEDELPDWLTATSQESPIATENEPSQESAPPFDEASAFQSSTDQQPITETHQEEASSSQPATEDIIPDWMKEAGWGPAGERTDDSTLPLEINDNGDLEGELAPADIPDWLQAIAPEDTLISEEDTDSQTEKPTGELLTWLEETTPELSEGEESNIEGSQDETISDTQTGKLEPEDQSLGETPEWLESSEKEDQVEIPEWLKELNIDSALEEPSGDAEFEKEPISEEPLIEAREATDIPDWLEDLHESDETEQDQSQPPESISVESVEQNLETESAAVELEPDLSEQEEEVQPEIPPSGSADSQNISEWLRSLDEESIPEDLSEEAAGEEETTRSELEAAETPATELDDDAAFEWLESLAAKQGADKSLLFTSEDRQDTPPDWVRESLENAPEGKEGVTETGEVQPGEDIPDWVSDLEKSTEAEPASTEATGSELTDQEAEKALPEWLRGLEEETLTGDEEDLTGQTQEEGFESPTQAADELPDWLKGLKDETAAVSEIKSGPADQISEADKLDTEELPDWLRNIDEEAKYESTHLQAETSSDEFQIEEGITGWLSRLDETPAGDKAEGFEVSPLELAEAHETPSESSDLLSEEEESPISAILPSDEDFEQVESITSDLDVDKFLNIEEPPVIEGDTKPSQISKSEAAETKIEEIEPTSSEPEEDLTVQEGITSTFEGSLAEQDELAEPEFLEPSEEGELEAVSYEVPVESLPLEEDSLTAEVQNLDEDTEAAFAWLESLAARQGASEEDLLLSPEERQETPPDWVQKAETEEIMVDSEIESEWVQESIETQPEETLEVTPEPFEETTESKIEPSFEESELEEIETQPEETPEEAPEPIEETAESEIEPSTEEFGAEEREGIPELPDWLAEIEESETVDASETTWSPPTEESTFELETAVGEDLQSDETMEAQEEQYPEAEPAEVLNINQAGLIELERLPGIGFTRAQAIIAYRETFGPFSSIEDLQNVAGIEPIHLEGIRELIKFEEPEEEAVGQPVDEHQMSLIQARNALIQGDSEIALDQYLNLIKARRLLPEVINDLHEALYRFPVDVTIWQTLGDAYMRSGQLQDALDAYTKAEELLR